VARQRLPAHLQGGIRVLRSVHRYQSRVQVRACRRQPKVSLVFNRNYSAISVTKKYNYFDQLLFFHLRTRQPHTRVNKNSLALPNETELQNKLIKIIFISYDIETCFLVKCDTSCKPDLSLIYKQY